MRRWLAMCFLLLMASPLLAEQEDVRIGVLAHRPKPQVQQQWAPLAEALNHDIPKHRFAVAAYTFEELQAAVSARQVDFVLTNPGHYVLVSRRVGLSAPLATLANLEQGKPVSAFGGVIFTRVDREGIRELADVRGKTVAFTSTDSLGGYQMQAYELLKAGVDPARDFRPLLTGMPHDNVVDAVLSGRADVGFVRSGLIEGMTREGKLDQAKVRVLNAQALAAFPVQVSTRLYPEWAFAALPHTSKDVTRKVASFLLSIEDDPDLTRALHIHGFDVASDYTPVVELLRELRMPPFDVTPAFTWHDVWSRYLWQIAGGVVAAILILLLGIRLFLSNRRLKAEHALVESQNYILKENELRFRTVADYTYDWEYWQGPDHRIRYISPSCERVTGYNAEAFISDPDLLLRIVHPDDRHLMEAHLEHAWHFEGEESVDFRIVRRDGAERWIGHVCQAVYDENGRFNGRRVSNRDITDRKLAEDKRVESELRLRAIIESEPECIKILDKNGCLLEMNPAGLEMIEADSLEQVRGRPMINIIAPEFREAYGNLHMQVIAGQPMQMEFRIVGLKGGQRWLETHSVPMREADGRVVHLSVTRDISERKHAEQVLLQDRDAAEALAKSKSEFLANMSHEIRTPMNGIIGLSQLALNQQTSPELRDYLGKIHSSSQSLLGILNDILDFSKLEAGRMHVENAPFDLDNVLDNLRNLFEQHAHDKSLEFRIEIDQGTPRDLVGDAMRLQQILSNLIGNAIKFTAHGGVGMHIGVRSREDSSVILAFDVFDSGIGLSRESIDKLFQPFSQVDTSITRRFGGTGLGLAISQSLLQLMGGAFRVESEAGKGSIFGFDLLFGIAAHGKVRATRHRPERKPDSLATEFGTISQNQNLKGLRILLVEDNAINLQVVREFLKISGIQVVSANNGQEALEMLDKQEVDAILMDVHMPVMGGVEATRRIRAQAKYASLPIIALSAGVTQEERDNCLSCGMNDFVAKPVNPEALLAALLKWVRINPG